MSSISSEASMTRSSDKDDTSDSSWQLPSTQTANTGEQAKHDALRTDGAGVESCISEKGPEKSDVMEDAIAAHNNKVDPENANEDTKSFGLSLRAERLCRITDGILDSMCQVETAMIHLHEYIKAQDEDTKPLYQWARFDGYRVLSRALTRLDRAVAKFEKVHLPVAFVKTYLSRATQISLTVSQAAVFSMGVMGEKAASCIDEIEESTLSAEGKVNAQAVITEELKKLLKHCAKATDRVYTTLDLLRNSLHIDKSNDDADMSMLKVLVAESQARLNTPRKSWLWSGVRTMLGAATSALIALTVAHLYSTSGFELAHQANPNSMHSQVISLVQRAQAVTNLTGEIYSIKLEDLGQRYKELEAASESHGLRIDNLV